MKLSTSPSFVRGPRGEFPSCFVRRVSDNESAIAVGNSNLVMAMPMRSFSFLNLLASGIAVTRGDQREGLGETFQICGIIRIPQRLCGH